MIIREQTKKIRKGLKTGIQLKALNEKGWKVIN